jgi:chromosome segregation ATPase
MRLHWYVISERYAALVSALRPLQDRLAPLQMKLARLEAKIEANGNSIKEFQRVVKPYLPLIERTIEDKWKAEDLFRGDGKEGEEEPVMDLSSRIRDLQGTSNDLRGKVTGLQSKVIGLEKKTAKLEGTNAKLEEKKVKLQEKIGVLSASLSRSRKLVHDFKDKLLVATGLRRW